MLAYGQLVLATGAQAIRVPLEGDAAAQVLSVNSLQDFSAFHAQLQPAKTGRGPFSFVKKSKALHRFA